MTENNISVAEYCRYNSIDTAFVQQLHENGLLTIETREQQTVIAYEELPTLERYMHLHYDLDINMAGIEAIQHLLNRLQETRQQLAALQNRTFPFH